MTEQEKILQNFSKFFGSMDGKRIILYGLGINTEYIVNNCPDNILITGLMDAQNEGNTFWGYRVLSAQEATKFGDIIVVVARTSVLKVIFERIQHLSDIMPIYTTSGILLKNLFVNDSEEYSNQPIWDFAPSHIYEEIDKHSVISFDMFDTLVMRKTLNPNDIFDIVEQKSGLKTGIFSSARRKAEKLLKEEMETPGIHEIYPELSQILKTEKISTRTLMELEFQTELENIVPRKDVYCYLEYAKKTGKQVIILSDMYWPEEKLRGILTSVGIQDYDELIVSCEFHKSKEKGTLYDEVKRKYGDDILHIGDNKIADIQMAQESGISSIQILSAQELLLHSTLQRLLVNVRTLADRKLMGEFMSDILNSPFALTESKGIWKINSERTLAKYCFAPIVTGFLVWLLDTVKKDAENTTILFTARDGYLFKKLYDNVVKNLAPEIDGRLPRSIYFHTSRRAVSVANINNREDILFEVKRLHYTEKLGNILLQHFGVAPDENDVMKEVIVTTPKDMEVVYKYCLKYEQQILERAETERNEYLSYLKSLDISEKVYIFDLLCEGSVPRGIEKLLGRECILLAFGTMNIPNQYYKDETRIRSYLGNQGEYELGYKTFRYYKLLEMIAAPHEGGLRYFEAGRRVLESEVLSDAVYRKIAIVQDEIESSVLRYLELCRNDSFTCELLDDFLGLVSSKYSDADRIKGIFMYEDPSVGEKLYPAWNAIVD